MNQIGEMDAADVNADSQFLLSILVTKASFPCMLAQFRRLVRTIQSIAVTLNRHYPARLHRLYLVDAPVIVHLPVRVSLRPDLCAWGDSFEASSSGLCDESTWPPTLCKSRSRLIFLFQSLCFLITGTNCHVCFLGSSRDCDVTLTVMTWGKMNLPFLQH